MARSVTLKPPDKYFSDANAACSAARRLVRSLGDVARGMRGSLGPDGSENLAFIP
jgi:hypothetical protein